MAKFWRRHWFDAVMAAAGLLFYLYFVEDRRLFLLVLFMIGGNNLAAWARRGRLK